MIAKEIMKAGNTFESGSHESRIENQLPVQRQCGSHLVLHAFLLS